MLQWREMWLRALRLLACASAVVSCGGEAEEKCSQFRTDTVGLDVVETTTMQLSEGGSVEALIIADGDLYWYNDSGAIFKLPRGESRPMELRPAPGGFVGDAKRSSSDFAVAIDGFVSDEERLYWGEANRYIGPDSGSVVGLEPPSRLLSIAKTGGPDRVLLQSTDDTLRPVAVDGVRIIVRSSDGYYQLTENASHLEPLRANASLDTSRVVGDRIYWTEPAQDEPQLFRVDFDGAKPEVVTRIEGSDVEVGPDYVLWRQETLQTEPELVLEQNFVMLDEHSGCTRTLPGLGESISFTTALDDDSVYWYSFNALGAVTVTSEGESSAAPVMPLVRVNLGNGALQRLDTPGFNLGPGSQIVGHDAAQLFVSTAQGLVAVEKP